VNSYDILEFKNRNKTLLYTLANKMMQIIKIVKDFSNFRLRSTFLNFISLQIASTNVVQLLLCRHPITKWAQRKDRVFVEINLMDIVN